ncbi:MAG: TrgA family protein, partial [Roseovarius sp.]
MPTAGRAVAALGLGALAWYASGMVIALWPNQMDFGLFRPISAGLGVLVGWRVMGTRLGRGLMGGLSAGLTGLGALLFWCFLLFSFYEMIQRSLDLRYEGPVEAIQGMFEIAFEYAQNIYYWPLIGFLVLGAVVIALIAEVF